MNLDNNNILRAALTYPGIGLKVLPVKPRSKTPAIQKWQKQATTNPGKIASWWKTWPESNLGILMGKESGIVCLDIDPRNGGKEWYEEHKHKLTGGVFEITGGDGIHIYFKHPGGVVKSKSGKNGISAGVELLADGGHQIVATPSIHPSGKPYFIKNGQCLSIAIAEAEVLPKWLYLDEHNPKTETVKNIQIKDKLEKHDRDVLLQSLNSLDSSCRHNQIGHWVHNAVISGMEDDEIIELGEQWIRKNGREPQANEISNWIKTSHKNTNKGDIRLIPGIRTDIVFKEDVNNKKINGNDIITQSNSLINWTELLDVTESQTPKPTYKNSILILSNDKSVKGCIGYNEFAQSSAIITPPPWEPNKSLGYDGAAINDMDVFQLMYWLATEYCEPSKDKVYDAIEYVAIKNSYHPVRDYLNSLTWDKISRIDNWLENYLGAKGNSKYLKAVGSKWLISAVARIFSPGCKVDHILILEGEQGIGKSTVCRIIGGRWFVDEIGAFGSKDCIDAMRNAWIVELSELDSLNKAESTRAKAFLSRTTDRARLAYGRRTKDFPRQCVFIGTSNLTEYLKDESGGRRFWPVNCNRIDTVSLTNDMEQIWAEAVARYKDGEKWHLEDGVEIDLAKKEQLERYASDELTYPIQNFLESEHEDSLGIIVKEGRIMAIPGIMIWENALENYNKDFSRLDQNRIGRIMGSLNWKRKTVVIDGVHVKAYARPTE